jgi:hypothetical protein
MGEWVNFFHSIKSVQLGLFVAGALIFTQIVEVFPWNLGRWKQVFKVVGLAVAIISFLGAVKAIQEEHIADLKIRSLVVYMVADITGSWTPEKRPYGNGTFAEDLREINFASFSGLKDKPYILGLNIPYNGSSGFEDIVPGQHVRFTAKLMPEDPTALLGQLPSVLKQINTVSVAIPMLGWRLSKQTLVLEHIGFRFVVNGETAIEFDKTLNYPGMFFERTYPAWRSEFLQGIFFLNNKEINLKQNFL